MFRSSITPRPSPSQLRPAHKLKCVICGLVRHNKIAEKYTISEKLKADDFRNAAQFLQDDVFTRICNLTTNDHIFSADISIIITVFRGIYELLNHQKKHKLRQKRNSKRKKGLL